MHIRKDSDSSGYTIVEAMVAISLLMLAVGAAASLSMTIVRQEEVNARAARATNWQENSARLYQLGIGADNDPTAILAIMPELPNRVSYSATPFTITSAALPAGNNTIGGADLTLVYRSDTGSTNRTSVVKAVRY